MKLREIDESASTMANVFSLLKIFSKFLLGLLNSLISMELMQGDF